MRHAMTQPIGTYAFNSKTVDRASHIATQAIINSTAITAGTHVALTRENVGALRHIIYESPPSVWESRLSFTAHLKRIDIPATAHGALYRLMAAQPERRLTCIDLVDIDQMLDGHLSLFVAAAP